jgi:hypothetical protein
MVNFVCHATMAHISSWAKKICCRLLIVAVLLCFVDFTSHSVSSRASLRTVLHEQSQMNN